MTFIASVVAKKGVAIIADSLVTSMTRVIEYDSFLNYIKDKSKSTPLDEIKIDPIEVVKLFKRKPSHTKDFEEKLFMYDKYTAVTTAGSASINKKRIETLMKEIIERNKKNKGYSRKRIDTKIKEFCESINKEAIEHLNQFEEISGTTFIISHYNKSKEKTEVFKVDVISCNKTDIKDDNFNCALHKKMDDYYKVVCDGQNRISERILFGEVDFFLDITPKIIRKVISDLNIDPTTLPLDYEKNFFSEAKSFLPEQFFNDMKVNKLADLSLQQAVDLASLLMKIEINFQKYTENIPTVGGVIKLAVIDKEGFRFISGNDILKPENLN
jgi:20S proteasome alpha/beta subunit